MMEFFNRQIIESARKPHKCECCEKTIAKGESYIRETGKFNGDFFSRAWHTDCGEVMNYFFDFLSTEEEFDYWEVYEDVQEKLCRLCEASHWFNDECEEDLWHCTKIQDEIRRIYREAICNDKQG